MGKGNLVSSAFPTGLLRSRGRNLCASCEQVNSLQDQEPLCCVWQATLEGQIGKPPGLVPEGSLKEATKGVGSLAESHHMCHSALSCLLEATEAGVTLIFIIVPLQRALDPSVECHTQKLLYRPTPQCPAVLSDTCYLKPGVYSSQGASVEHMCPQLLGCSW